VIKQYRVVSGTADAILCLHFSPLIVPLFSLLTCLDAFRNALSCMAHMTSTKHQQEPKHNLNTKPTTWLFARPPSRPPAELPFRSRQGQGAEGHDLPPGGWVDQSVLRYLRFRCLGTAVLLQSVVQLLCCACSTSSLRVTSSPSQPPVMISTHNSHNCVPPPPTQNIVLSLPVPNPGVAHHQPSRPRSSLPLQCEKLGQTIIFVRTRDTARSLHEVVRLPARLPACLPACLLPSCCCVKSPRRWLLAAQGYSRILLCWCSSTAQLPAMSQPPGSLIIHPQLNANARLPSSSLTHSILSA
jgi:hypothetical protein